MGIRGFEWMVYTDDLGGRWLLRVDADYAVDPDRGWSARLEADTAIWPQGWQPRLVIGLDAEGHTQRARIGSTDAPLWTREVLTFAFNASDQLVAAAVVTRYVSERRLPAPPELP